MDQTQLLFLILAAIFGFLLGFLFAHLRSQTQWRQLVEEKSILSAQVEQLHLTESLAQERTLALGREIIEETRLKLSEDSRQQWDQTKEFAQSELEQRKQAIGSLVSPLQSQLNLLQERLRDLENKRISAYEGLNRQVGHLVEDQGKLRAETQRLVKALRQPTTRGQWGEMQLRRSVELAGMIEHCDFVTQAQSTTGTGDKLRPDLVVMLPGRAHLVVDAKTPLEAYLEYVEAESEEEKDGFLKQHANQLRKHIQQLSAKSYQEQFEISPDFVVLYLPSEGIFASALEADPKLLEFAASQRIVLASPSTLIALLRSVALVWRQERLDQDARRIIELGREFGKRCEVLESHFNKLENSLNQAQESFRQARASFDSRVFTQGKKIANHALGESANDDISA